MAKDKRNRGVAKYAGQKPQRTPKPEDQDDRRRKTSEATMARREGKQKGK